MSYSLSPFLSGYKFAAIDWIDDQITLLEGAGAGSMGMHPVKINAVIAIVCEMGSMKGNLDMKEFTASGPFLFIILSDQTLSCDYFSDDFKAKTIILSRKFWDGFPLDKSLSFPLFRSIREYPSIQLKKEELDSITDFFRLMQKTIRNKENKNRAEAVKYLTIAFFLGFSFSYHPIEENLNIAKQDKLVQNFLKIVRENFRVHRNISFYANKLDRTPKYLSKAIKQSSRKTAAEWIEDHVIMEASALLKSTNNTIQQISDELNFPSQSFFGKYFKRRTGLSPKEYRKTS